MYAYTKLNLSFRTTQGTVIWWTFFTWPAWLHTLITQGDGSWKSSPIITQVWWSHSLGCPLSQVVIGTGFPVHYDWCMYTIWLKCTCSNTSWFVQVYSYTLWWLCVCVLQWVSSSSMAPTPLTLRGSLTPSKPPRPASWPPCHTASSSCHKGRRPGGGD